MAVSLLRIGRQLSCLGCAKYTRGSTLTLCQRSIMTTRPKLEKVLENLQKNPYFDKYSQKIAKLQETSPEEFLQRIEEKERKIKEEKEKREQEKKFQQASKAKPSLDPTLQKKEPRLSDIMKIDLIQDKNKEEIIEIWREYHKQKDCISGIMSPEQYDKIFDRGAKFSTFLLPLPRSNGYEFIMCQFHGSEIHMTPLLWYQVHKENAPECLTIVHYTELRDSKNLVLMRGEFDANSINVQEAQCLLNELQLYYSTDDPQRLKLLETFIHKPDEFKHMDLIAQLETISLEPVADTSAKSMKSITFPALVRYPVQYQWPFKSYIWNLNQLSKPNIRRCYVNYPSNNQYVTTPIFYVNAGPHIGHLYSAVLADAVTRFQSMLGHTTFMSTGTDEHGNKVERAARDASLPIDKYCTQISQKFRDMCDKFDVGYSDYIRTTETRHRDTVHQFWNTLKAGGHIYLGKYSGWYCESDEAFLTDLDLTEKKTASGEIIKVSNESGHPVEWTEENNYKFRLSNFQDDLKHWLKDEKAVQPSKYHKILLSWIEDGACLEDLSVSRPVRRVPWGISVPQDDTHSIYVWLDALVNYLTAIGYPEERYKKFWPPSIQVIGKDILKFHGVYWPAFLIAAGLEPPKTLLCHSHWTVESEKMSKSKGNVVSPSEAAATFTEDGLRYFLLREAVPHSDANYSAVKVQRIVNSELADTLGNLVSRCTGKTVNPTREIPNPAEFSDVLKSDSAKSLLRNLEALKDTAEKSYKEYNLHHVVDAVMSTLHSANQMVDYHKPWQLRKETDNPESMNQLKAVISLALETARISGLILYPIVPKMSSNLLDYLSVPPENRTWEDARSKHLHDSPSESRQLGQGNTILFRRIRN